MRFLTIFCQIRSLNYGDYKDYFAKNDIEDMMVKNKKIE